MFLVMLWKPVLSSTETQSCIKYVLLPTVLLSVLGPSENGYWQALLLTSVQVPCVFRLIPNKEVNAEGGLQNTKVWGKSEEKCLYYHTALQLIDAALSML